LTQGNGRGGREGKERKREVQERLLEWNKEFGLFVECIIFVFTRPMDMKAEEARRTSKRGVEKEKRLDWETNVCLCKNARSRKSHSSSLMGTARCTWKRAIEG